MSAPALGVWGPLTTPVDLANAVHRVEKRSARSKQRKLGASEIGTCKKRVAYRLAGTPPTDDPGGMQAALGKWIHKGALEVMRREFGAVIEVKLENDIFKSSSDAYFPDTHVVEDVKTKSARAFEKAVERGPRRQELYQTQIYGWMLREGHFQKRERRLSGRQEVDEILIRFLSRDNGKMSVHTRPYDHELTVEAVNWTADVLDQLESHGPDEVRRDWFGPGVSIECDYCPFATACWGTPAAGLLPQSVLIHDDADLAEALEDYDRLGEEMKPLKEARDFRRAQLEGQMRGIYGEMVLGWQKDSQPKEVPDEDAMVEFFREAGIEVPTKFTSGRKGSIVVRRATAKDFEAAEAARAARDAIFGTPVALDSAEA